MHKMVSVVLLTVVMVTVVMVTVVMVPLVVLSAVTILAIAMVIVTTLELTRVPVIMSMSGTASVLRECNVTNDVKFSVRCNQLVVFDFHETIILLLDILGCHVATVADKTRFTGAVVFSGAGSTILTKSRRA